MKRAYIFPGQGSQYEGMGKNIYENNEAARAWFESANDILGFRISEIMFSGTSEELRQTNVTQPAVFLHSVIAFLTIAVDKPDMVAGHSLGEFSALVANGCLAFEDALNLVSIRAKAMQKACEMNPSTMAAVLALDDEKVERICASIKNEIVVPANYNCPGQIVISGSIKGIEEACKLLKEAGAKRTLILPVGGAFHSPLMQPAKEELSAAIEKTVIDPIEIKSNLISQLTGPVRWTQTIMKMVDDGANHFTESGPGKVLQRLVQKINKEVQVDGIG